jgi:hypothetical protein
MIGTTQINVCYHLLTPLQVLPSFIGAFINLDIAITYHNLLKMLQLSKLPSFHYKKMWFFGKCNLTKNVHIDQGGI